MQITGISNFYNIFPDLKNVKLDLEKIKSAEQEVKDIPESKPRKKRIDYYSGGYGTYSNRTKSENIKCFKEMIKDVEAKANKPDWKYIPVGETSQLRYRSSSNVGRIMDIKN